MERPDRCLLCESRLKNPVCQLPAASVLRFDEFSDTLHFRNGETLFRQGEETGDVYLISSGRVKLVHEHPDGAAQILRVAGTGEALGLGLALGPRFLASAVARGAVSACRARLESVERLAQRDAEFGLAWMHLLMDEIRRARETVYHLGPHPAGIRLARFLVDALGAEERDRAAIVALNHGEIAASIAVAQETVTRLLSDLETRGVVRLGRGKIEVLDLDRLLAVAGYPGSVVAPLTSS
ncbi:MAG: Crp/Fnr family transcriptional regulator [Candidatus Eisenbacteria bacterium]